MANKNESIKCIILHGGKFYSAGNDLSKFAQADSVENMKKLAEYGVKEVMSKMLKTFCDSHKPIIAVVTGACYGIAFTMLSLADFVYCTPEVVFCAPFIKSFQSPEGSSILSFREIFGARFAAEILLLDKEVTAKEALHHGFVTKVLDNQPITGDDLDYNKVPCLRYLQQADYKTLVNCKVMMNEGRNPKRYHEIIDYEA